jgi:hypothetical protein
VHQLPATNHAFLRNGTSHYPLCSNVVLRVCSPGEYSLDG